MHHSTPLRKRAIAGGFSIRSKTYKRFQLRDLLAHTMGYSGARAQALVRGLTSFTSGGSDEAEASWQDVALDTEALGRNPFKRANQEREKDLLEYVPGGELGAPCDAAGVLPDSFARKDHKTCHFWDACISVMPKDFYEQTHWPKCVDEHGNNICKEHVGRPLCVSQDYLHRYGGPVEVNCNGSGHGVFLGPRDPAPKTVEPDDGPPDSRLGGLQAQSDRPLQNSTGCWVLKKAKALEITKGLSRLPGQIYTSGKETGWFVNKGYNGVKPLTYFQAYVWMKDGKLLEDAQAKDFYERKVAQAACPPCWLTHTGLEKRLGEATAATIPVGKEA